VVGLDVLSLILWKLCRIDMGMMRDLVDDILLKPGAVENVE